MIINRKIKCNQFSDIITGTRECQECDYFSRVIYTIENKVDCNCDVLNGNLIDEVI